MSAVGSPGGDDAILVVEDDRGTQRLLIDTLRRAGHSVVAVGGGVDALRTFAQQPVALVVLDLGLPDLDGVDVLRSLCSWRTDVSVMVVSARGDEQDKVAALRAGADDYLAKPFGLDELVARIEAHLRRRRRRSADEPSIAAGDVEIDLAAHLVRRQGVSIRLTPIEVGVLRELVSHAGTVRSHRDVLVAVWGPYFAQERGYVRTIVQRLRQKVEADASRPVHILTVPGVGYMWRSAG